jgi:hypothetical protein
MSREELAGAVTLLFEAGNQFDECLPLRKQLPVALAQVCGELRSRLGAVQSELADLLVHVDPDLIAIQGRRQFVPALLEVGREGDHTEAIPKEAEGQKVKIFVLDLQLAER